MKCSKKILSLCLAFAVIMSFCTFNVAHAASLTAEATDIGSDYVTLSWSPDSGSYYYHINQNGSQIWEGGSTSHTITGLTPNTTYQFEVWAQETEHWSWVCNTFITVKTAEAATPYAEITNRTSTSLEITLYNVSENGTYHISSVTGNGEAALEDTAFTGTVFTDTNLQPATTYTYTIYPEDESFADITVSGTTVPEYKIEATEITDTSVTLEWVKKEGTAGHKLHVSSKSPGALIPERFASPSDIYDVTRFTVTGLSPSTEYDFEVIPLNASWVFLPSYKITVTTAETPDPYALISERTVSSLTIQLYNVNKNEPHYITAAKFCDGTIVLDKVEFTGTSYTHQGLDESTTYNYTITNADNTVSVTVSGTTKAVYKIEVTGRTEDSISLSWVNTEDAANGYKIQVSSPNGGEVPDKYRDSNSTAGFDFNGTSHTITGLSSNKQYTIKIIAMNASWSWGYTYNISAETLAAVTGFEAVAINANDVTMRWPAVEGSSYFNVYRIENGTEKLAGENINAVERTFKDVWLKHSTEYSYVVKAFNESGEEIEITAFDNRLTVTTAANTRWNNDKGEEYYTSGKLAGQNIRHETYYSELMDIEVGYNIHIPTGYNPNDDKRYPVLYFLHPLGGDENSWVSDVWGATYAEPLLDPNMGGDNMFIVYVNNAQDQWYTDAANEVYYGRSTILYELIPHIDAKYKTIAEKKGRALDGFSMGGAGSLLLAFERPDMFNSVLTNSAAVSNSLEDFVRMAWGAQNTVFGYDVNKNAADAYYNQEGIYAVYEKNKDKIEEYGLNIFMRWGDIDPVALISNQKMYDLLSTNKGINLRQEVLKGYDHSGVYYGDLWNMLNFHRANLIFSGEGASDKTYNIGSVNTFLGDVFVEKGSGSLPSDAKLLVTSYDSNNSVIDCQLLDISSSVKTDFKPVAGADYVKVFLWSMGNIKPVCASKTEDIL